MSTAFLISYVCVCRGERHG